MDVIAPPPPQQQAPGLEPTGCVRKYVTRLNSGRWFVIVAWLLAAAVLGLFGAVQLISLTKNEFDPPPGSEAATAKDKLHEYFGNIDSNATDLLYIEAPVGKDVFSGNFMDSFTVGAQSYLQDNLDTSLPLPTLNGFTSTLRLYGAGPASVFLGKDNASTFMQISYPSNATTKYGRVFEGLVKHLRSEACPDAAFVGCAGIGCGAVETIDATVESVSRMDEISLPLAFLILAYCLSSVRLLLIPLLAVPVSLLVSFGAMGLLARMGLKVSSVSPPVMMSTLIAVSIDYALFLLTRFREEILADSRKNVELAVSRMLAYSGHVVLSSGVILSLCFVSLLFIPMALVQSLGTGVIVTLLSAIAINLSLVPALLLAMPRFFADFRCWGLACCCRCNRSARRPSEGLLEGNAEPRGDVAPEGGKLWQRWSVFATSSSASWLVAAIVLLGGVLASLKFAGFKPSQDTALFSPRGAPSSETQDRLALSFSVGQSGPYQLLLVPQVDSPLGIYEPGFWNQSAQLLQGVSGLYGDDSEGTISSVVYTYEARTRQGKHVPAMLAQFLDPHVNSSGVCEQLPILKEECKKYAQSNDCRDLEQFAPIIGKWLPGISAAAVQQLCEGFRRQLEATTAAPSGPEKTRRALFATLAPSRVPASQAAVDWARDCRDLLKAFQPRMPGVTTYLSGLTPSVMDAINAVYEVLPAVFSITLGLCAVLLGIFNKSVAFGVLPVVFIAWTIVVVFALAMCVYQDGLFGSDGVLGNTGGLAWLVPCLTFTVILGLGLDYCMFLLGRVVELHLEGLGDRDALAEGLSKTGPIITNAGVIMAVAYGGLMFSSIPMLNQVSLILVLAVLIDTFFIRSLQFPATHAPLKGWNWWPRRQTSRSSEQLRGCDPCAPS
eukprot:TRINITY_DN38514_c0_g2_i1.p1 TRINITY_DN38514_c0_g2~~TRINITY_DN38514_c0_g2_i1.p1  ORF type:complete len:890 (-),score=124.98 TRINITY_DN38514_c0_g2_i1:265-2934(-)